MDLLLLSFSVVVKNYTLINCSVIKVFRVSAKGKKKEREKKKEIKKIKRKKGRKKHRKKFQHQIAPPKGRSRLTTVQYVAELLTICHFVRVTVTKAIIRTANQKP